MTHSEAGLLEEVEEGLSFVTLLTDVLARIVNLPTDQIDREIKKVPPDKKRGFS